MMKTILSVILLLLSCDLFASTNNSITDTLKPEQFIKIRDGLNTTYNRIVNEKDVTIAFLGGSITYNPGWRDKVCDYLKEKFPETKFHFIAAGIPSLGSLPHAFRLQRDVLDSGKVDLLFIEAAVNDRGNGTDSITQVRSLEGIVRHAKKSNPEMDIVLMSFADPEKTKDYDAGKTPVEVRNHELIATHYHLPSINLAKEVHDKMRNNEFSWEKDFKDLHPSPFGQELYFQAIKTLLGKCFNGLPSSIAKKNLPSALISSNFSDGKYVEPDKAKYDAKWNLQNDWQPNDSLETREGFVHVPILEASAPNATLSFSFEGNAVGICIVSGVDAGIISYSIDNGAFQKMDLYTQWSSFLHLPWYLILGSNLKNGKHELTIKIAEEKNEKSKGHACRIVHFLVNGK